MSARVGDVAVLVKIKPPSERALREILRAVEADHRDNRYLQLARSPSTHIANFVITDDPEHGKRLVFATVYDGALDDYLNELLEFGPGIDELFSTCVGYAGRAEFRSFVLANRAVSAGSFAGFPFETVANILRMIELREAVENFLDLPDVARFLESPGVQALFETVAQLAPGDVTLRAAPSRLDTVLTSLHGVFFGALLALARIYGTLIVDDTFKGVASNLGQQIDPATSDADHMTNLTEIRKGHQWLLRLGLAGLTLLGRYAFPPGLFGDVSTIHHARWMIVDGGKRMLFQSKFDGSWENYMGDFVDKIAWGIDAIFGHAVGYPSAGMKDIDTFKRFIRDRQCAHLVDYFAYPGETVLNIIRDRDIASAFQNLVAVPLAKQLLEAL
jgi:hypothetical protein